MSTTKPTSLADKLKSYKHLDDYEYYRGARLKQNAVNKFGLIMQSIKVQLTLQGAEEDETNDSDIIEDSNSEYFNFNQILKRHKKRLKQNVNLHHR